MMYWGELLSSCEVLDLAVLLKVLEFNIYLHIFCLFIFLLAIIFVSFKYVTLVVETQSGINNFSSKAFVELGDEHRRELSFWLSILPLAEDNRVGV